MIYDCFGIQTPIITASFMKQKQKLLYLSAISGDFYVPLKKARPVTRTCLTRVTTWIRNLFRTHPGSLCQSGAAVTCSRRQYLLLYPPVNGWLGWLITEWIYFSLKLTGDFHRTEMWHFHRLSLSAISVCGYSSRSSPLYYFLIISVQTECLVQISCQTELSVLLYRKLVGLTR